MCALSSKQQWLVGGILLLVMVATRGHITNHLQDASWAIFFLAGFYLRSWLGFAVFMAAAFFTDLAAINIAGVDNYCFTPAYGFTVPAYATLWAAGQWFAGQYKMHWSSAVKFFAAAVAGVLVSFLISNAGFYAFSNHFAEMGALEYAGSVAKYLPMYLQTTLFYLAIAALVHVAVQQTSRLNSQANSH